MILANKVLVCALTALSVCTSAIAIAKETPPLGGQPKNFVVPETETTTLENGLSVTFIPYGKTPKVTLRLITQTGNIDDGDSVWLSDISYEMLRQGTETASAKQLAENVANMGGEIDTSVGMDSSYIGMSVLSEFADDAAAMIADMVMHAKFEDSDLARIKADTQRRLTVSLSSPSAIANEAFYHSVYGNHAYGRLYPTSESIDALTTKAISEFVKTNPMETIEGLIRHRLGREDKVVRTMATMAAATVEQLTEKVYDDVPAALHGIAKYSLLAHLEKLEKENRASRQNALWALEQGH